MGLHTFYRTFVQENPIIKKTIHRVSRRQSINHKIIAHNIEKTSQKKAQCFMLENIVVTKEGEKKKNVLNAGPRAI